MDEVDERARGLCLEPLFQHGIPGVGVIDTMLKELDDQLLENNKQIEECVKELIDMSSGMAGPDVKFTNPAEAINYVAENHLLEKTACYDPEPDDVTRFLRHVIMVLEKHPGCEESVLDQLLQFSSQEGVALPIRSSMSDPMAQSILSINTAVDSAEHVNENLWSDISMRLRKYLIEKLQSLPLVMNKNKIQNNSQKRLKYVQSLCTLYPTPSIWPKYRNIRLHQLEALTFTLEIKEGKVSKFQKAVVELERILPQIIAMIDEDFQLLTSGVFGSIVAPFKAISEIYFEKLLDDISNIVESLQEELSVAVQKQDVKKKERHKESKDIPKSTSEAGFLGNLKGNLRRQHSLSMDSLLDKTDEPFTDLAVLPSDYLGGILRLTNSIVEIETHLEGLYNTLIWESTGNVGHKPTSKRRLKSALKSSHNMEEKKPAFRSRSFEKSGMLPDAIPPPFGASQAMIAEMSASLRVVEKPYEDRPRWEWRTLFRKLAPDITRCVEGHIHHASHKVTRDELQILERHGSLPTVAVAPLLAGGRLDYPKIVSEGFLEMMSVLDELLPVAQAGSETPFTSVRSVFLDATLLTLKSMNMQLAKLCADSPGLMPSNCLALMLSNAAYARNHLLYYEKVLGIDESNKKSFNGLHHQYEELVEALCRQIKEHHIQLLRTSILHDAESQNWSDDKEFYENERCSFDIQMWNLHLQTLRHELWKTCPPRLAQSIFVDVLVESLEVLSSRYSRVKPSYRRTAQFRTDIVTILLCTSELLFPACDTVTKYLDPSICETVVYKLHNCCHTLLTALTVVAAPLEALYKVYKKGFKKRRQNHDDDSVEGYLTQWLSWIRPSLFPQGITNCNELQTTTAIHLQLKLMHSQPQLNWSMLLKSLLMKDYTLPIMLLTKIAEQHQSQAKVEDEPFKVDADVTDIFNAFVDIMMKCDTFPAALARIVSPVLDRTSAWNLLDNKKILGKTDPIPPWMLALFKSISAHATRVIEPAIAVFQARLCNSSPQKDPLVCKMVELPCGCEPINTPDDGAMEKTSTTSMTDIAAFSMRVYPVLGYKHGSRDIVAEALYSLITQLVDDLHTLPASLLIFFHNAQSHLEEMRIQSTHNCAGLKMLVTAIRTMLLDLQYIETLVDSPLTEDMKDCLKMLAECFYHVLTASSYGKGSGTPRIAGLFMKANTSWLNEQIEVIVDHLTNDLFEPSDICPLEGATADFTDNLLLATASSIFNSNTGESSLTKVYNLLSNNAEWITSQLDIPPLVGSGSRGSPRRLPIVLSTSPVKPRELNPLEAYSQIGDYKLDHAAISEIDLPWQSMLQSDLGLTELGFRTLLFHRQEMQDGAFLEEVEKKPVQVLKSKFDPEFLD